MRQAFYQFLFARTFLCVGNQADLDLTCLKSLADEDIADVSSARALIIRANRIVFHPFQDAGQDRCVLRHSEPAVSAGNDAVGAAGVKTGDRTAVSALTDRKLRLVSITQNIRRWHNRLYRQFIL